MSVSGPEIPEQVVAMIADGFSMVKAYRHHAGLGLQNVAGRSGISVARLAIIESGRAATAGEMEAIGRTLCLVPSSQAGQQGSRRSERGF